MQSLPQKQLIILYGDYPDHINAWKKNLQPLIADLLRRFNPQKRAAVPDTVSALNGESPFRDVDMRQELKDPRGLTALSP
jgi:hypothetical protein